MEKLPFREHHLLLLLGQYDIMKLPLDLHIRNYFKENKALGSKDRAEIAEWAYSLIRWLGLIDYFCNHSTTWNKRWEFYKAHPIEELVKREGIPDHIQVSFPPALYELIIRSHGKEKGRELCFESNYPAPTTVRVNPIKISRDEIYLRWKESYEVTPCIQAPYGIVFNKKIHFYSLSEFQEGLFEIQDEGSQLLASLMKVEPGQQVLDYCAGSGGKTLAFAHRMKHRGQIYLHDIRPYVLLECKKRLKRAGIQNAQVLEPSSSKHSKLKKKMDWVLVDAPCTGTGTLRRNPDMKWKFSDETLPRLVGQQRAIFEKALSYLKPDGKIVYGTCSMLKEENEEQVEHFLRTYPLKLEGDPFRSLPERGGMDGFFGAVFGRK